VAWICLAEAEARAEEIINFVSFPPKFTPNANSLR